jgi:predicted cobalt transporter CbtA
MTMNLVHNERIRYAATALNNVGVGAILAGIVAPLVSGHVDDWRHILLWCALGFNLITLAHVTLGRLR